MACGTSKWGADWKEGKRDLHTLWQVLIPCFCVPSSWTEDTRAQIFSENLSTHGLLEAQCEELERKIEDKFMEFEELAAAGQKLVSEEHDLSETVSRMLSPPQGWVGDPSLASH